MRPFTYLLNLTNVNPRTVERRRAPSGAKTDAIDAYLLAKTGRADYAYLHRLVPDSEGIQELKILTHDIEYCAQRIYVVMSSQEGEVHLEPDSRAWFDWLATPLPSPLSVSLGL